MIKKFYNYGKDLALSKTAFHTYITTFGAGINALLGFVFTIVVARSLSPSDFGLFSVVSSLVLIFLGFSDLGMVAGATRFIPTATEEEKPKIIKVIYSVTFTVSVVLSLILFFGASFISQIIFKTANFSPLIVLASVAVLSLSLWTSSVGILYSKKEFVKGVIVDNSAVIFKLTAILILLFSYKLNLLSTISAFSFTPFLTLILAFLFIPPKFLLMPVSKDLLLKIFSFSAWIFLAKIAVTILGQIDNIMLVRLADPQATGIYAAANRITFVFPVIANGLSVVLMPKFAGFNQIEEAKKFLKKVMIVLGLFIIPVILLYIISDPLVFWIYGSSYAAASEVFRFLLLRTIFYLAATGPLTMLIYFFGQSKIFAFLSVLQLLILVIANLFFIPSFGAAGPAISGALSYGVIFFASIYIIFGKIKTAK